MCSSESRPPVGSKNQTLGNVTLIGRIYGNLKIQQGTTANRERMELEGRAKEPTNRVDGLESLFNLVFLPYEIHQGDRFHPQFKSQKPYRERSSNEAPL